MNDDFEEEYESEDDELPSESQPEVVTDPAEIAAAREAYAERINVFLSDATKRLNSGESLDGEHRFAFDQQPKEARALLNDYLHNVSHSTDIRCRTAANLLAGDGVPNAGRTFLLDAIQRADDDLCLEALNVLNEKSIYFRDDRDFIQPLSKLLRHHNLRIAAAAAALAGSLRLVELETQIAELIPRLDQEEQNRIVRSLSHVALKKETVQQLAKVIQSQDESEFTGSLESLCSANLGPEGEQARTALRDFILANQQRDKQWWYRCLAISGDESCVQLMKEIATTMKDENPRASMFSSRGSAAINRRYMIEGLCRLLPQQALALTLKLLQNIGMEWSVVKLLTKYARPSDGPAILQALRKSLAKKGDGYHSLNIDSLERLNALIGPEGWQLATEHAEQFGYETRQSLEWRAQGWSVVGACEELKAAGILQHVQPIKPRNTNASDEDVASKPPVWEVVEAFHADGSGEFFFYENFSSPAYNQTLLPRFAKLTRGKFQPEACLQSGEDLESGTLRLQFIHAGRLYRHNVTDMSDHFSVPDTVELINFCLEDRACRERLVLIDIDGPGYEYVFADPEALAPIAAKYGILIGPRHHHWRGSETEDEGMEDL